MKTTSEIAEGPGSILFVKPDSVGDLILFSPLLRWLRQRWPNTRIGLLLRSRYRDVVPLLPPGITLQYTSADPYRESVADPSSRESLTRSINEFAPEILVAASYETNWVHCVAAAAAPAARRISLGSFQLDPTTRQFLQQDGSNPAGDPFPETVGVLQDTPELEKFGLLASYLSGVKPPELSPWISLPAAALAEASAWLATKGLTTKNFVVCNPAGTANVAIKGWPTSSYAEVINWLQTDRGLPVLLCAHQDEKALVDQVLDEVGSSAKPAVWLGRDGQLPMMAAFAAHATAYLGTDTSTLHAAEAVDTPVAGIYGGGTWPRFRPAGRRSIAIVHPIPCFGCGWHCHFGDAPCVKLIKTSDVIRALASWLSAKDTKPQTSRTIELAHLPLSYLQELRRSREIYDRLLDGYSSRHAQVLELTALSCRHEEESAARQKQILELTALVHQRDDESAARQQQILELTALVRHHESESAARHAQILELTTLVERCTDENAVYRGQTLELTALVQNLERESTSRHAQIIELTALVQQRSDESAARQQQILELTALVHHHENESALRHTQVLELSRLVEQRSDESAARHAQIVELTRLIQQRADDRADCQAAILKLTALVHLHESESAARRAQVAELTELAQRQSRETSELREATATFQREIASLSAEMQLRDQAAQTQLRTFAIEKEDLNRQIAELKIDREKFERIVQTMSGDLAGRTDELAALQKNKWVRLGRKIRLISVPPSP